MRILFALFAGERGKLGSEQKFIFVFIRFVLCENDTNINNILVIQVLELSDGMRERGGVVCLCEWFLCY